MIRVRAILPRLSSFKTLLHVCRDKARLPSGCKSHPAKFDRSSRKLSERRWRQRSRRSLGWKGSVDDSAREWAVTRVNTEQAPKTSDAEADPRPRRGRPPETTTTPGAEVKRTENERVVSSAGVMVTARSQEGNHATREACLVAARDGQPNAREGQVGPSEVAERLVVPLKPGNAGGGKGPSFRFDVERSES